MSYTKPQGEPLKQNEKQHSDGTELIPAEVQANIRHDKDQSTGIPFADGYTIDDEGLINNFAIEPDIYPSDYPSPRQQWQYKVLGAAAFFFILMLILTSILVS